MKIKENVIFYFHSFDFVVSFLTILADDWKEIGKLIKTFSELIDKAKQKGPKTIAVAVAQDRDVLSAVNNAYQQGIIKAILVGNRVEIEAIAQEIEMDLTDFEIIDEPDKNEACKKSVKLVHDGKASMPMKGIVDTPIILKAVLNSDFGLKSGRLLSHVGVLSIPGFSRLLIQSDAAINIVPSFREKIDIINNAVSVAHALGNELPKVALLCAVEKVNPKMQATIDAEELTRLNEIGEIKECLVKGPLALDNAISIEAAKHKGISHPVAGNADILITPNIEAGNILNKTLEHFCKAEKAGIIIGANVPIILTSRAASKESKLNSIALGVLISHK